MSDSVSRKEFEAFRVTTERDIKEIKEGQIIKLENLCRTEFTLIHQQLADHGQQLAELRQDVRELKQGQAELKQGQAELRQGLEKTNELLEQLMLSIKPD